MHRIHQEAVADTLVSEGWFRVSAAVMAAADEVAAERGLCEHPVAMQVRQDAWTHGADFAGFPGLADSSPERMGPLCSST